MITLNSISMFLSIVHFATVTTATAYYWRDVLTLGKSNNEYNGQIYDVGQAEFNRIFREDSPHHIIRRECGTCLASHQEIYYKRITDIDTFDVYNVIKVWTSSDDTNNITIDFNLYSTLNDALMDTNAWTYCNYNDINAGIGAFRDCGPSGIVGCQITGDKNANGWQNFQYQACMHDTKFSIYVTASYRPWRDALTLGYPDNAYNEQIFDVGQTEFNRMFREDSHQHIIKRECDTCIASHQEIYYKRITDIDTFDVYSLMILFTSSNNNISIDFNLYSTLDDALMDINAWSYCNYNDIADGIGAFRDCGPSGFVGCQITGDKDANGWNVHTCPNTQNGMHDTKFSIYVDSCSVDMDCDDALYCNGVEYCIDEQCYNGIPIDCGFAFFCDEQSQSCERDCDSFDIDAYLQCSSAFDAVEGSIISIDAELDNVNTTIQGLESRITVNENDIMNIRANIGNTITTGINQLQTDVGVLGSRVTTNEGDIIVLEANITALKTEVESSGTVFNGHIITVHDRIDDNEGDITGLDSRVYTIEGDVATLQTNVGNNTNLILSNLASINTNIQSLNAIDGDVMNIQMDLERIENKIGQFGKKRKQNAAANANSLNIMNEGDEYNDDGKLDSILQKLTMKDILIIGLLFINMLMSIYNCYFVNRNCHKIPNVKYSKVMAQCSDSELSHDQN